MIQAREAQFDVSTIVRDVVSPEYVIPNTEGYSEIHSVFIVFWKIIRVMPNMHLWIVENILEETDV